MLFNSQAFLLFLPVVFILFWSLARAPLRLQNLVILAASYYFYARWDWRFLGLLFASSLIDYGVGIGLETARTPARRRLLLVASLAASVGFLGTFKYLGFFVAQFSALLTSLGIQAHPASLSIILPAGISFYTFQTMNYTIDVYKREIKACRDPVAFFAFVSFFPHLVAGPIQRASNLLPQFYTKREFDTARASDGVRQMLWGFVKKVVVADNLSGHVNHVFANDAGLDSLSCWIGAFLFAMQIYCDFSGYSDIAIGTARLFGFNLIRNFEYPYFAANIAEFWRRWHISLSTWFRDYVYIPLGGAKVGPVRKAFNIMVTFTVSGLWHGANWTFVAWGALHGFYYVCWMWLFGRGQAPAASRSRVRTAVGILATFLATLVAWVFFRAESISGAVRYLGRLFALSPGAGTVRYLPLSALGLCVGMLAVEWLQRHRQHALEMPALPPAARWVVYYALVLLIYFVGNFQHVPFIYFQF